MNKFKTYAFWVALSSAIVILVQSLGKLFGFEVDGSTIENVIMSICGVLVVLGIVTKSSEKQESKVDYTIDKLVEESNSKNETIVDVEIESLEENKNTEVIEQSEPEIIEVQDSKVNDIIYIENNTENT